ncbi:hypothetical protein K438DRAFT_1776388 [Mycena galopus ATCC 62051]|nr:hypothetical protein K438DRAFT_1776388 [Mycena galopus ATCC 62051]
MRQNGYLWAFPAKQKDSTVVKGDENTTLKRYYFGKRTMAHKPLMLTYNPGAAFNFRALPIVYLCANLPGRLPRAWSIATLILILARFKSSRHTPSRDTRRLFPAAKLTIIRAFIIHAPSPSVCIPTHDPYVIGPRAGYRRPLACKFEGLGARRRRRRCAQQKGAVGPESSVPVCTYRCRQAVQNSGRDAVPRGHRPALYHVLTAFHRSGFACTNLRVPHGNQRSTSKCCRRETIGAFVSISPSHEIESCAGYGYRRHVQCETGDAADDSSGHWQWTHGIPSHSRFREDHLITVARPAWHPSQHFSPARGVPIQPRVCAAPPPPDSTRALLVLPIPCPRFPCAITYRVRFLRWGNPEESVISSQEQMDKVLFHYAGTCGEFDSAGHTLGALRGISRPRSRIYLALLVFVFVLRLEFFSFALRLSP